MYNHILIQLIFNSATISHPLSTFTSLSIMDNPIIYKYIQQYSDELNTNIMNLYSIDELYELTLEYTTNEFTLFIRKTSGRGIGYRMTFQDGVHLLFYIKLMNLEI